jgi:hypothetical protein
VCAWIYSRLCFTLSPTGQAGVSEFDVPCVCKYLNSRGSYAAKINMAILSTNPASILHRKSAPTNAHGWLVESDEEPVAPEPAAPQATPAAPQATAPTQADVALLMSLQWTADQA